MAKKQAVNPAAELAKAIEESLVRRRSENAGYPASLRDVAFGVAPNVSESELRAALAKATATTRPVLAIDGDLDSLAVLNDKADIARLAGDECLLRQLCEALCSPQQPLVSVNEMAAAGVLAKKLVTPFKAHWGGRLKSGSLPSFVQAVTIPGKTPKATEIKLHDLRFPLPWLSLSKDLVRACVEQSGSRGVIAEWSALVAPFAGADSEKYVALARTCEPFQSQVVPVLTKDPSGWLMLTENAERVARDPRVLDRVFQSSLKASDTAVEVGVLKKQKLLNPLLATAFSLYLDELSENSPAGFGVLRHSKKLLLFRLCDVSRGSSAEEVQPAAPRDAEVVQPRSQPTPEQATTFAAAFGQVFARLDASEGGYNLVKLLPLRLALSQYDRATFDAELHALRLARQYSLMPSEGNGITLSDPEMNAGIQEAGTRLVYCKKIG